MVIRTCSFCQHHEIRKESEEEKSFCGKEYCWSEYSKCIAHIALEKFFTEEKRVSASEKLSSELK